MRPRKSYPQSPRKVQSLRLEGGSPLPPRVHLTRHARIVDEFKSRARSKRISAGPRQSAYFVRGSFIRTARGVAGATPSAHRNLQKFPKFLPSPGTGDALRWFVTIGIAASTEKSLANLISASTRGRDRHRRGQSQRNWPREFFPSASRGAKWDRRAQWHRYGRIALFRRGASARF